MKLGGPIFEPITDPDMWVRMLRERGYSAAYAPEIQPDSGFVEEDFAAAASKENIIIAEVGAWSNPLDTDETKRRQAIQYCQERLAVAERFGAKCCVNIAGSISEQWDGPHPDNLSEATFELIVDTVREIIDGVKPERTYYTLETMPYLYPDSVDSYVRLIDAIDRKAFAVHFDPVNLVSSPQIFYHNSDLIRDFVRRLGPYIRSCHAKDIQLASRLTVHLDEVRPGLGGLDYRTLLSELERLNPDMPLMLEHLPNEHEYEQAANYVRRVGQEIGVEWR